ncbi:hypothetical protein [Candidatus Palauibacter sp.]|uniref:hypothetical protein n=1 Tax=Candidatus Palauibacter sp. TaxID=3101350 RepID=UPI003C6ECF8A
MTELVVIMTGAWNEQVDTEIALEGGDLSYVVLDEGGSSVPTDPTGTIRYTLGRPGVTSEPHVSVARGLGAAVVRG